MNLYIFSIVKTHLDHNYHRKEFSPTSVRYNNLLCLKKDMRRTSSPFSLHISQVLHSIHFHSYPRNVSPISPSSIQVGCPRYYDELHRIISKKERESTTASTVGASNHMFGFLFSISTIVSPAESTVLLATRLSFSL